MKTKTVQIILVLLVLESFCSWARADDTVVEAQLTLTNHTFDPQTLTLPVGQRVKLTIINKDTSAAEFESGDLGREKVVPAQGQIYVYLSPLDPGTYRFYDDFHSKTTTGTIVVR